MTDPRWGLLIVGFLFGILFAIGCVVVYSHEWIEEQSVAINGAYWRGFDDGWNGCGCSQGDGGGESESLQIINATLIASDGERIGGGSGGHPDLPEYGISDYPTQIIR